MILTERRTKLWRNGAWRTNWLGQATCRRTRYLLSAVGHPNVAGAARMAEQCVKAIAAGNTMEAAV